MSNPRVNMPSAQQPNRAPGRISGPGGRFMRPVEKPKNAGKTILRLATFFKGQLWQVIVSFLLVLTTSVVSLRAPLYMGRAIDALDNMEPIAVLQKIVLALILLYVVDTFARFSQGWLVSAISQRTVRSLRQTMFAKLQKLPVRFFDAYPHGELMSRLSNDTDNIAGILGSAVTQMMSIVIILVGSLVTMLVLSPVMTFFSLISIPLVFLLTKTIARNTRRYFKQQQEALGRLNACVEENVTGIHIVKAYSHEKYAIEELAEINEQLRVVSTGAQVWSGSIMPIMNVINNLSFTIVAGAGSVLAVNGFISIGTIAMFITYSRQFGRPLNDLASMYNSLQSALASAERVFDVLDSEEERPEPADARELAHTKGGVRFENVSFGYKPNEPVLRNVSFTVKPGSTIALVGPTGAGKTTIVNLITRFYDVTDGKIWLDGHNVEDYTRDSLRRAFGIVLQDTYLFTGTIRENICYGREDATEDEIVAAAKASGAHLYIERLPNGYDTMLTESGQNLSEGQRQLLAIARAVLFDPDILILDEATSSVDTRTELRIQEAFMTLMKGRTSFMIAHRLSTIVGADVIMLVQNGELAEVGSHTELMALGGRYCEMFNMQANGISIDAEERQE